MSAEFLQPLQPLSPSNLRPLMSWSEWILVKLLVIGIPAVLLVAWFLIPDPRGFGTHQQLGLPACMFRTLTGFKCAHCGITTSFCWFVRGEWKNSVHANPSGFLLAMICVAVWPWLMVVSVRRRWLGHQEPGRMFLMVSGGWLVLSLMVWVWRLA